jgi:hypothetical protein
LFDLASVASRTNIAFDDGHYFTGRLKAIGFPEWNDVKRFPATLLSMPICPAVSAGDQLHLSLFRWISGYPLYFGVGRRRGFPDRAGHTSTVYQLLLVRIRRYRDLPDDQPTRRATR